ncbi:hypothetical protein AGMMS50293_29440 [Spirochaetia bacterium]|nr:hypothetical protein AGMMS50293_29440 [Spirochaetia bacterium]
MKKYVFPGLLLVALLAFLSISCKSSPPQAETAPPTAEPASPAGEPAPAQPGGPSQAVLDALNKAVNRAEEARKRALDFESPSYFPSDWESVESQYTAAGTLPKSSEAEVQQATVAYNAAADTYDELFKKTIPLYAQAREDEIIAARDDLIATGLTYSFPEYLRKADEIALSALSQYEAQDYYTARDTAIKALGEYQTLKTGADAYLVRLEIVDRDFISYDPENFDRADEIALTALNAYDTGDYETAQSNAEEALLRYNLVLVTGWAGYVSAQRTSATDERKKALDLKANIAVRDSFRDADALYNQAELALKSELYENSAALYTESEARFMMVSRDAAEKRRIAEETIKEAGEKIDESDETARQAEVIIEGGSI